LAALLSLATESVAAKTGDAVGGLLNATLGNLTELVIALAAPWLAPYSPYEQSLENRLRPPWFLGGTSEHILGTDLLGRDYLSRMIYGARLALLGGVAENFRKHGFRRLVFLNGHGGNDVPGRQAVFELRQKHRDRSDLLLLLATYWSLGARPWESDPAIEQREMGHACEWETSMILRLDPRLVGDHRAVPPVPFGKGFEPAVRGWVTPELTPIDP